MELEYWTTLYYIGLLHWINIGYRACLSCVGSKRTLGRPPNITASMRLNGFGSNNGRVGEGRGIGTSDRTNEFYVQRVASMTGQGVVS